MPFSALEHRTQRQESHRVKPRVSQAVAFLQLWPKEHGEGEKPGRGAG